MSHSVAQPALLGEVVTSASEALTEADEARPVEMDRINNAMFYSVLWSFKY